MHVFKQLQLAQTETSIHTSLVKIWPSFGLFFFSFLSDAIDQMKEELKENILLLPENTFVGFAQNFTETFTFV